MFLLQLALLSSYVSSFTRVGSFEEAVWLLKAKNALKALGGTSVRAEIQTSFLTLDSKVDYIGPIPECSHMVYHASNVSNIASFYRNFQIYGLHSNVHL